MNLATALDPQRRAVSEDEAHQAGRHEAWLRDAGALLESAPNANAYAYAYADAFANADANAFAYADADAFAFAKGDV